MKDAFQPVKTSGNTIEMPTLALRGLVIMPAMVINFDVAREKSIRAIKQAMQSDRKIFLTAQKDIMTEDPAQDDLYEIGVVAEVRQVLKVQGDNQRVLVEGLYRAKIDEMLLTTPYLAASVKEFPLKNIKRDVLKEQALVRSVKNAFETYCSLSPKMPKEIVINIMTNEDPIVLSEFIAGNLMLGAQQKQLILEQSDYMKRLESLIAMLEEENKILKLEHEISEKVREQMDENQRDYYLREQLRVISAELGEEDDPVSEADEYRTGILALGLESEVQQKFLKEADKLAKFPPGSHEGSVVRNYLDTCLALPWNKRSKEKNDVNAAQRVLNRDHHGMEKVKQRILEFVAVRKLAPDIKGQIICLEGPPGVGKTSIAKSLAKALGREYARISLGGVKDESEIRGHRKTYIGAMPGRIIDAVKTAGVKNPLILLDEIDKMSNDFKGDPSSAMLEVLDAEQNYAFRDHYVEVPFDLSEVLFITTANDVDAIPGPLKDRMEMISLSSYTREEKFQIAKKHLLPKQLKKHGLCSRQLKLSDKGLYAILDFYTRESGVRLLERHLAKICRKTAKLIAGGEAEKCAVTDQNIQDFLGVKKYKIDRCSKQDRVGVVTGLAWTSVGGETMEIECSALKGDGKIILTGSLGDVMQESAKTAVSYVRGVADQYGIDPDFHKKYDIHIHAAEGAVPKDGPSAGVTMATALVSELTSIPVRSDVAMTGEISLKGNVLAIGGLREKTMAAYRYGVATVIIPKENEADLQEADEKVRRSMQFLLADSVQTVLDHALVKNDIFINITQTDEKRRCAKPVDATIQNVHVCADN